MAIRWKTLASSYPATDDPRHGKEPNKSKSQDGGHDGRHLDAPLGACNAVDAIGSQPYGDYSRH